MTKLQFATVVAAALLLFGFCSQSTSVDATKIGDAIKVDMAQLLASYNARDAAKTASHDAKNIVQMVHGSNNIVGETADLLSDKQQFADNPVAHTTLTHGTVDVAAAGDMAIYRATYYATYTDAETKKVRTDRGNYIASYKKQSDGSWKIEWAVASNTAPDLPSTH